MHTKTLSCISILTVLTFCSCSSGPTPPQPGTPAFYWSAANQTWRTGDYQKVCENLSLITKSKNDFTSQAQPWLVVVSSGLAQGYSELADKLEPGAKLAKTGSGAIHRTVNTSRSTASNYALMFAEAVHLLLTDNKSEKIALNFPYPTGSMAEPGQLAKIEKGMVLPPAEQDQLELAMLQRGVLMSTARAVGASGDSAKTMSVFQGGNVEAPRGVFLLEMAQLLHQQADLFGAKKLDQPNRAKLLLNEALEAVGAVPESKESKALGVKIQTSLKKLRQS